MFGCDLLSVFYDGYSDTSFYTGWANKLYVHGLYTLSLINQGLILTTAATVM